MEKNMERDTWNLGLFWVLEELSLGKGIWRAVKLLSTEDNPHFGGLEDPPIVGNSRLSALPHSP